MHRTGTCRARQAGQGRVTGQNVAAWQPRGVTARWQSWQTSRVRDRLVRFGVATLGASALLTLLLRGFGLASQSLVATTFGASAQLDAYFIGLLVPGLVVTALAGAVELSLSPVIARLRVEDPGSARVLAKRLALLALVTGVVLSVVAVTLAPWLIRLLAPSAGVGRQTLAIGAARWLHASIAPQIVSAAVVAVHYGHGRVQLPIAIKVANPLATILTVVLVPDLDIEVLAAASFIGSLVEMVLLMATMPRAASTPGAAVAAVDVREVLRTIRPLLVTSGVGRLVPLIDQVFVSGLEPGDLTRFALAFRLFDIASTALVLPSARLAVKRMSESGPGGVPSRRAVRRELTFAGFVGGVSSAALLLGSPMILLLAFRHGEFTMSDVWATAGIAAVLAPGVAFISLAFVAQRAMVAVGSGSYLWRLGFIEVICNLLLDAALVGPFGAAGVAGATVVSYLVMVILLLRAIRAEVS